VNIREGMPPSAGHEGEQRKRVLTDEERIA